MGRSVTSGLARRSGAPLSAIGAPELRFFLVVEVAMNHRMLSAFLFVALLGSTGTAIAGDTALDVVQYPDKRSVDVPFIATERAPAGASLEAEVKLAEGQARIDLSYGKMQPAALFGGNVAAYVVWCVSRSGVVENLGELFVEDESGSTRYQTGMKEFAMFVTAEPVPGVWHPSDMVVFRSGPTKSKYAKNSTQAFPALAAPPRHDHESIGALTWKPGTEPLVLYQARRAYEVGTEIGLEKYDEKAMREAQTTLAQATNSTKAGGSSKAVTDYARRTMALVATAARAMNKAEQERAEAEAAAKRQAELDALAQKADEARRSAEAADAARQQAEDAERRAQELRSKAEMEKGEAEKAKADMAAAAAALEAQKKDLESRMAGLQAEKDAAERAKADLASTAAGLEAQKRDLEAQTAALSAENQRIEAERDALSKRLTGALATVADTQNTARGVVVNLSDILFDTNEATLKPDARLALAKLTGVLSVFPNLNLRVEGYTDSTGSDAINDRLSRERAAAVAVFLKGQGIAETRMKSEGYGAKFPKAPNDTSEGRSKNRRVEIILAEGTIAAPAG